MKWNRLPGVQRLARQLATLSDTPLDAEIFASKCLDFGWKRDNDEADFCRLHLPLPDRYLHLTLQNERLQFAVLPLLFWEDYDEDFAASPAIYRHERATFDRNSERAFQQCAEVLGPPLRQWTQPDADQFRKALWRGETCWLALQQNDYDEQLGFDIDFLLQPLQGETPASVQLLA